MTTQFITMFDDTDVSKLPAGPDFAYAGYVGGLFPTFPELQRRFPGHRLLSIAVNASEDAECLDIEKGDATVEDAPGWFKRQVARGVAFPVLYCSAGNLIALESTMAAAGISRLAYRLWSAHYTHAEHLCSPKTCGFGFTEVDGTQWTNQANGISLDQSVLIPEFFSTGSPVPDWEVTIMNKLPTLQQGAKDTPGHVYFVSRMQALIKVLAQINNIAGAKDLVIDGNFGAATKDALEAIQHHWGLTQDGVCGPKSWALLVSGWSS
jgi:peptidoglycan hydrolase-like protein with peptidoglycan-binding domain